MNRWLFFCACSAALAGCGPSAPPPESAPPSPPSTAPPEREPPHPPSLPDAPEISRSVGVKGGVVLFWPRTIPRSDDAAIERIAGEVQKSLAALVEEALPGREVDRRPMPERVCPRDGCDAMTVGALLLHRDGGCAVLGLVAGAGKASTRIVPWAGVVKLKNEQAGFREPPENEVVIRDAVPCEQVIAALKENRAGVVTAVKEAR